ncbi:MAG: hypothetical protein AAGA67_02465 [Cyanobacteria bacterium P01_F01_bin.153]
MPVTHKSRKSSEIGWGFWLQWILVTLIGFLVSLYWVEVGGTPDLNAVEGVIGGAAIGVAQWCVIRQKFPKAWWWMLVSVVGWGVLGLSHIGAVGWTAPSTSNIYLRILYGVLKGAQVGLLMGIAQWLVLRMCVPKAEQWILASVAGWAFGLSLGWSVGEMLHRITGIFRGEVAGLFFSWSVVAVVTGSILVKLAKRCIPEFG